MMSQRCRPTLTSTLPYRRVVAMTILGIDPGSHRCGWAVVNYVGSTPELIAHGCFDYPAKSEVGNRLMSLESDLVKLFQTHKPNLVVVESLFFNKNTTTAMHVAEARGVISLTTAKLGVDTLDCSPLQVKMAITGYGRSEKSQIKQMIQMQFKNADLHKLDDAVDAIAVAVTGHVLNSTKKFMESKK